MRLHHLMTQEHLRSQGEKLHEGGNMLIAKVLRSLSPHLTSSITFHHYKDIAAAYQASSSYSGGPACREELEALQKRQVSELV